MSRIAQLRASLSSFTTSPTRVLFLRTITRQEWAEFVRAYKYDRSQAYLSVRETKRLERTRAYWEDRWEGPLNS